MPIGKSKPKSMPRAKPRGKKSKVIFITGPTGVGKTEISIALARKIKGEIVCCDSMQVYKGLDILTNKPTPKQLSKVPHHLFGFKDPKKDFSVAEYRKLALKKIKKIHKRGRIPIFVGGTGLYVQALLDGLFSSPAKDLALRKKLKGQAKRYGAAWLYEKLKKIDPAAGATIHPNDTRRIIRALEVYQSTGRPISQMKQESCGGIFQGYPTYVSCFFYKNRDILYKRINQRVLGMFNAGVVDEAKRALGAKLSMTASQALGLKQIQRFIKGRYGLERAKEILMRDTRRYAKRQLSWFRRDKRVKWIALDKCKGPKDAVKNLLTLLSL